MESERWGGMGTFRGLGLVCRDSRQELGSCAGKCGEIGPPGRYSPESWEGRTGRKRKVQGPQVGRGPGSPVEGGGMERLLPREVLAPAALIGPAHVHPKKSVTTLKKETNAPVLFAALFVN